jgi:hypothetical protein
MRKVFAVFILGNFETTLRANFLSKLAYFFMFDKVFSEELFVAAKVRALNNHIHTVEHVLLIFFPLDLYIASFSLVLAANSQLLELIDQKWMRGRSRKLVIAFLDYTTGASS